MSADGGGRERVTVIVPVYRGRDEVARCLESVLRHAATTTTPFDLLVIDDASPEPEVGEYLEELGRRADVTVLRNDENLGFVVTCNRGLRVATGDVVLLNADTAVTEGWLDRLAAAARPADVATVTPLTNFGSICTLPPSVIDAFGLDGDAPQIDACAEFVREHSLERRPEVITGVGFCMYIARRALDLCGLLDVETFGKGYGEEVDFCLRASALRLRHVVEDSTYVFHQGAVSFGEGRQDGLRRGSELIHRRYPYFRAMNLAERAEDPLRVPFAALELGLRDRRRDRRHVLQILHSGPGELGGTEKHLWQLMEELVDEFDLSIFQPLDAGYLLTTTWRSCAGELVCDEFHVPGGVRAFGEIDDPGAAAALRTVLDMFDFDAVHIQNIFHHSLAPLAVLSDFPGPVACSVRELYLACPNHWLLYRNERACGIPDDLSVCARCLPETRGLDVDFLTTFRRTVAERLGTVDRWVFASQSALDLFLRAYDLDPDRVEIIPHGAIIDPDRAARRVDEGRVLDEPLRLAYVGIGWAKKGFPTLNRLAEELADTGIEFHHFGELREAVSPRVRVHGRYDNRVLPELLDRAGIHVVLFPGAIPETFGHVMTEAMAAGLPVIAARYGALGERIRRSEAGWTIEPEDFEGIRVLVEDLDRCRPEVLRATRRAVAAELRPVAATADRYAAIYRSDGGEPAIKRSAERAGGSMTDQERLQRELRAMGTVNRQLHVQLEKEKAAARRGAGGAGAIRAWGAAEHLHPRGLARRGVRQLRRARMVVHQRGLRRATKGAVRKVRRRLRGLARG